MAVQYMSVPVAVIGKVIALMRASFTSAPFNVDWGYKTDFLLDGMGILIYLFICCLVIVGLKWISKMVYGNLFIKWGAALILMVMIIYAIGSEKGQGFVIMANNTQINFKSFLGVLLPTFCLMLGLEAFVMVGREMKNGERNMPIVILLVLWSTILFYIVVSVLMMGTIISTGFGPNPNVQIFNRLNNNTLKWLGAIVMLVTIFTTKINNGMQLTYYNIQAPLRMFSREGYISPWFSHQDGNGTCKRNLILYCGSIIFSSFMFLIVPDIIVWAAKLPQSYFNYADMLTMTVFLVLVADIILVGIAISLKFKHHKNISNGLVAYWIIAFPFLVCFVFYFLYVTIYDGIIKAPIKDLPFALVQLSFIAIILMVILGQYFFYYAPILKARLAKNPALQKVLDSHFRILPFNNKLERYAAIIDQAGTINSSQAKIEAVYQKLIFYDLYADFAFAEASSLDQVAYLIDIPFSNQYRMDHIKGHLTIIKDEHDHLLNERQKYAV